MIGHLLPLQLSDENGNSSVESIKTMLWQLFAWIGTINILLWIKELKIFEECASILHKIWSKLCDIVCEIMYHRKVFSGH